jgi:isochorismate pyruvate lyase
MKSPNECNSLSEIRSQIDQLDRQIIALLGQRFEYVKEVVKYKSNSSEIIAQERFNEVISSRRQLALENNLSPDTIEKVYRILLEYFIEEEYHLLRKNNPNV